MNEQTAFQIDRKDYRIAGVLYCAGVSTGKSVNVVSRETHTIHDTLWGGGTRTLTTTRRCPAPVEGVITLGTESVVIEHGTFLGKPAMVTMYVHPVLFAAWQPAPGPSLLEAQKRVLAITCALNPKGRKDWRDRWNVSKEDWDSVVAELCTLGLLKKNGAKTAEGRNAASDSYMSRYYLLVGLNGESDLS